ncbi:calcium-independent phospholipase A2-gamma-like [Anneissia japonica]|uniref:calcium-independent phospholipase A2-gamma-like n=1 Tax=Anneissia japonica TaxID=1529436 RepID=UPI001425A365|nr:calcium-independent phospholipase A2-gamma-like [Anneissia japonica]
MMTMAVNHQHGMLLSFKTRLFYRSVENRISRPKMYSNRQFTVRKHFRRIQVIQGSPGKSKFNIYSICDTNVQHLQSISLNSIPKRGSSSNHGGKHSENNSLKTNDVFRLSRNGTVEVLNKINTGIEQRYSEMKQKSNAMMNSIKETVSKSTVSFRPATIFQSKPDGNYADKRGQCKPEEADAHHKELTSNETDFKSEHFNSIVSSEDSSTHLIEENNPLENNNTASYNNIGIQDNMSNSEEDNVIVNEKTVDNVNTQKMRKMMSLPSLSDLKSTSSYKNATSFTENTLKKAASKTDSMTLDLQETFTSIKDKISSIPKIDQLSTLQRLKGGNKKKTKSAFERNMDLPSPQGEIYTLEDTLLKMGEMAGSAVNVVSTSNRTANSTEKGTASKMKKHLEQTARTVKQLENTEQKNQNILKSQTISKASIDNRTKALAMGVRLAETTAMKLLRVERLAEHVLQYPDSRGIAVKEKVIPSLLKMQKTWDKALAEHVHMCLVLLGYVAPVKARGLRVLSIDGGGARGVIPIVVLREFERRTNCRIRDMFDYVMGVSSGGVLAFLLTFGKSTLAECSEIYKQQSLEVFKRNSLIGTGKLFLNHAFYDTEGWTKILKTYPMASERMIEFGKDPTCPKVATVATLINQGALKDYLFRNYNLPAGVTSRYMGSSSYPCWQALRASSAAPGYFEEHKLDDYIFQDGGVLTNNPSALAIHECKLLWPNTPIQCVISLGTGRWDPQGAEANQGFSTLKEKLVKIMLSATDTQSVHTIMNDLLPPKTYYRFNPFLSEDFDLDENRPEKLATMENDIHSYLEQNEQKITDAVNALMLKKTSLQKVGDWINHQKDLYHT